jgi:hypothetical protein
MRSDWFPRRDLRSWRTIAEHQGSTTLPGASPCVSRPITPTTGTWTTVPPLVRTEALEIGIGLATCLVLKGAKSLHPDHPNSARLSVR